MDRPTVLPSIVLLVALHLAAAQTQMVDYNPDTHLTTVSTEIVTCHCQAQSRKVVLTNAV
jgi:hypothetical protein